jgi:glycosyltransferase involved in cell wall biosynthesis
MKLLAVCTWCPAPPVNGTQQRTFHLLHAICRRHAVRLVTFARPSDDRTGGELALLCESVDVAPGSPFIDGPPGMRGLLSARPRSLVQAYSREVAALVRERLKGCDAAIAFALPAAPYLIDAGRPFIVEEIEVGLLRDAVTGAATARRRLRARLTWWKVAGFVRRLVDQAAHATVASEVERAQLLEIGCDADRVTVVPNGVAVTDLAVNETPERDTIIYPGSITYAANLDAMQYFLVSVLPHVRRARPGARLRITGDVDGPSRSALPPAEGVDIAGRLADIQTAIGRSRVVVVPLRHGSGTRLKVLQAMAVGTPVVSTTKGIEGLGLAGGIDVLVADEPAAFAAHVVRLLEDDELHARLSARGRAVAASRGWERSGEILNTLLERSGPGRPTA